MSKVRCDVLYAITSKSQFILFFYRFCVPNKQVLDQFLHHPIDTRDEMLEAYMVGQRLVKFLSVILPTHLEYSNQIDIRYKAARERSLEQLAVVTKYVDQIALLIDKQEHEDYISLVINQHQNEKREETYYADDVTDDGERNSAYLATSHTRGSDSTERLNNISTGNSETSLRKDQSHGQIASNRTEQRPLSVPIVGSTPSKSAYQSCTHDNSTVSDSVDVLYDNTNSSSKDSFVREDPISTASHTILRVVSPYQDVPATTNIPDKKEQSVINGFHQDKIAHQDVRNKEVSFSTIGSNEVLISETEQTSAGSHWDAAHRIDKNRDVQNDTETSFSSVDRSFGSNHKILPKGTIQQSPGGSVRNIIRSWPPKQDPPGDPPGKNADLPVVVKRTTPPASLQPSNTKTSFGCNKNVTGASTSQVETITLQQKPMTELQMAAELDKVSPSKNLQNDPETMNSKCLGRRDPSIVSQVTRLSSNSYSTSSCELSAAEDSDCVVTASCIAKSNAVSPNLHETKSEQSPILTSAGYISDPLCHDRNKKENIDEHNISLDSLGFPKVDHSVLSQMGEPDALLEARIISIASSAAIASSLNKNKRDDRRNPSDHESFTFPVQFKSPLEDNKNNDNADTGKDDVLSVVAAKNLSISDVAVNCKDTSRQSGPVDLDDSTATDRTITPDDNMETVSAASRRFPSDGLDYVLPLTKGISCTKDTIPIAGSYAPSAADWSIDEEIESSNRRFTRENSSISIDSTEFSVQPQKPKDDKDNNRQNITKFEEASDNAFGYSADWSPVWSPQEFDLTLTSDINGKVIDRSNASNLSVGRPDLSYEAWDEVWNSATKRSNESCTSDSRKKLLAKGNVIRKGDFGTDRTSSTESSSSTSRSRDLPQDTSTEKKLGLLNSYSSPLQVDTESPFMIDSKTEQRLRLPMNGYQNVPCKKPNSLSVPIHNAGLYGSLKGFQSLDCIFPFDQDHNDQNVDGGRGSILFCRSRATATTRQRSPNEEDWEESSLLMIENQRDNPRFKSCVRCLLK